MSREARIGLLVLGAILGVYLAATWLRGTGLFRGSQRLVPAQFAHVSGLRTSDLVTVRGVPVGQVHSIQPLATSVVVWLAIEPELQLQADASAEIVVKEILGGKLVELHPGLSAQPFAANDTLPGLPVFDIPIALRQMGHLFQALDRDRLQRLLANLDTATRNLAALSASVSPSRVDALTRDLAGASASLRRQVQDAEDRRLVQDADQLLADLRALSAQVQRTATQVNSLLPQIGTPAAAAAQDAQRLLARANTLLDSLSTNGSVAGKLLTDPAFARQLEDALVGINQTLRYIRGDSLSVGIRLGRRKR